MKLTWGSCLLACVLLGQPAFAQPAWFMEPVRNARMEYLLDQAPSALVMDTLRKRYPKVEFFTHPTMNGFYAKGSRSELLVLRRDVKTLDVLPVSPEPIVRDLVKREFIEIAEFGIPASGAEDLRVVLRSLIQDVSLELTPDSRFLILEGTPQALEQAREMLFSPYVRFEPRAVLDLRLLEISQSGRKKILGESPGPSGGPDVYKPSKDIRREFVNGIEIPLEIELR